VDADADADEGKEGDEIEGDWLKGWMLRWWVGDEEVRYGGKFYMDIKEAPGAQSYLGDESLGVKNSRGGFLVLTRYGSICLGEFYRNTESSHMFWIFSLRVGCESAFEHAIHW